MILDRIVKQKKEDLNNCKIKCNISILEDKIKKSPKPKNFRAALQKDIGGKHRIIAEVKKASPSKGIIREIFQPVQIAQDYEKNGAVALSVLTEEKFFLGKTAYLTEIRQHVTLPVLRKDFLFDPYQMYESRACGADAVLLIAAVLSQEQLNDLLLLANELSLSALVEVHTREELYRALHAGAEIIGINNRNLTTFKTDLETTFKLLPDIPKEKTIVSESGISSYSEIKQLCNAGVNAFLIGESFMRAESPGAKLKEFVG